MLASVSVIFIEHAALVLSGFQKTQGPVGYVGSLRSDQCLHYVSRQYLARICVTIHFVIQKLPLSVGHQNHGSLA